MTSENRLCARSNCGKLGVHLCSGCGEELYCSKDCQKEHWPRHMQACKAAVKPQTAAFQQSFDELSTKQLKNLIKAKAATFEPKKRATVLEQLDKVVERNNLLWLVKNHVNPSEIDVLLTNNPPSVQPTQMEIPGSSSRGQSKRKVPTTQRNAPQPGQVPSPQQLKEQAKLMRKNPELVRQSNPMFSKMTNQQIIAYADQLDKAASDPNMMKEIEKMSTMSSHERDQIQFIQEGLSGQREMNDVWFTGVIKTLKNDTALVKNLFKGKGQMLGGVTDAQIESFIDGASKMDASTLKMIGKTLVYLGGLVKPATDYYNKLNAITFGQANLILTTFVVIILVLCFYTSYRVFIWIYKLIVAYFFQSTTVKNDSVANVVEKVATTTVSKVAETVLKVAVETAESEFEF